MPSLKEARLRHSRYYAELLNQADDSSYTGQAGLVRGLAQSDLNRANIVAGQAWASLYAAEIEGAKTCIRYAAFGETCLDLRIDPREQIKWLHAALTASLQLEVDSVIPTLIAGIGIAYSMLGEIDRAVEYHQKGLQVASELADRSGVWMAASNLIDAYLMLGQPEQAFDLLKRYSHLAFEATGPRAMIGATGLLGTTLQAIGQPRKAIPCFQDALKFSRELGDQRDECTALVHLGSAYLDLAQYQEAYAAYDEALGISQRLGDRNSIAIILAHLGDIRLSLKDPDQANDLYLQAMALAEARGDQIGIATNLGNLANVCLMRGDYQNAISIYEQELQLTRAIANKLLQGAVLLNLSLIHISLVDDVTARNYLAEAEAIFMILEIPLPQEFMSAQLMLKIPRPIRHAFKRLGSWLYSRSRFTRGLSYEHSTRSA